VGVFVEGAVDVGLAAAVPLDGLGEPLGVVRQVDVVGDTGQREDVVDRAAEPAAVERIGRVGGG
jgi:hypothetical protein